MTSEFYEGLYQRSNTVFRLYRYLDKANLGNAKVAGLETDLNLTSTQYSVALTILYPSYMLVELPASLLLKRLGPHREYLIV